MSAGPPGRIYRVGFIIEYSIGHVTFAKMLQRVVQADPSVEADWFLIGPTTKLWPAAMFPFSRNYSLAVSASVPAPWMAAMFRDAVATVKVYGEEIDSFPVPDSVANPRE